MNIVLGIVLFFAIVLVLAAVGKKDTGKKKSTYEFNPNYHGVNCECSQCCPRRY